MMKQLLLQSQKNEIFRILRDSGLDPNDFEFGETETVYHEDITGYNTIMQKVNTIKSGKRTDYYFLFNIDEDGIYRLRYRPAYKNSTLIGRVRGGWDAAISVFKEWIDLVKREFAEPDLWDEFAKYQFTDSEIAADTSNEPFTIPQFEQIAEAIDKVYAYLKEHSIKTDEQDNFVRAQLSHLKESAKRFGKKDWLNMCIGSLVTIAASLALQPEQANTIWRIIKAAVSGIIHFLP